MAHESVLCTCFASHTYLCYACAHEIQAFRISSVVVNIYGYIYIDCMLCGLLFLYIVTLSRRRPTVARARRSFIHIFSPSASHSTLRSRDVVGSFHSRDSTISRVLCQIRSLQLSCLTSSFHTTHLSIIFIITKSYCRHIT